ncbi:hypothetical protein GOP47_0022461 [Adiantum capillus-veneris]|uniref:Uncharacterized protein n=1 Tax=Adiantum capillus-veneris TaxID=13818 RepID=A0A9D4U5T7_ADICA|nr:hypothetical protein GOP47_0022461 [Adiantum capillus-veneris]
MDWSLLDCGYHWRRNIQTQAIGWENVTETSEWLSASTLPDHFEAIGTDKGSNNNRYAERNKSSAGSIRYRSKPEHGADHIKS